MVLRAKAAPKRKFNIAKVAGSATGLNYIKSEDRVFEERALLWPSRKEGDEGAAA
jgi:antitoxin VapB